MDKNTNNEEIFKKLIEDFLKDAKIETITFDIEDFFENPERYKNDPRYKTAFLQNVISDYILEENFKSAEDIIKSVQNEDIKFALLQTAIGKLLMELGNIKVARKFLYEFEKSFYSLKNRKEYVYYAIDIYTYFLQFFSEDFLSGECYELSKWEVKNINNFLKKLKPHIEYVIKKKFGKDVFYFSIISLLESISICLYLSINSNYIDKNIKEDYRSLAEVLVKNKNRINFRNMSKYLLEIDGDLKNIIKIKISEIEGYLEDLLVEELLEEL